MKKVKLSSSADTPNDEKIFVVETPSVIREKMRLRDVVKELDYIEVHTANLNLKKVELEDIKSKMDAILNKV